MILNYTSMQSNYLIFLVLILVNLSCKKEIYEKKDDRKLTFIDDFNELDINRKVWDTEFSWGQFESDEVGFYYSDTAFEIIDGILHIKAQQDTIVGLVHDDNFNYFYKTFNYYSGMLHSAEGFEQQYGYFEIRCKVPFGYGFWPAFWLMSKSGWPPEIDVFEILGREPNKLILTTHFLDKDKKKRQNAKSIYGPDFSKDFHTFGLEWNPKEIIWYLDNKKVLKLF